MMMKNKNKKHHHTATAKKTTTTVINTCPSYRTGHHVPLERDVKRLRDLVKPHVNSFNYFLNEGLARGIRDVEPSQLDLIEPRTQTQRQGQQQSQQLSQINLDELTTVQYWIENVRVSKPTKSSQGGSTYGFNLLPRECRERGLMYSGRMTGSLCVQTIKRRNGVEFPSKPLKLTGKSFGQLPIMVMSNKCHLNSTGSSNANNNSSSTPSQLVHLKEEDNEFGGYFIVNGIERCVRLLQVPRRNHITAITRGSYKNRGPTYSDKGVAIRCARYTGDESCITNTLHYLITGCANIKFTCRKQEFLIPVILVLRSLSCGGNGGSSSSNNNNHQSGAAASSGPSGADYAAGGVGNTTAASTSNNANNMGVTDEELYNRIVQGDTQNTFLVARARLLLQDARARYPNLNTPADCLAYIGARFRRLTFKSEATSDVDIGHFIIRKYVLIHLQSYDDKLECLLLMIRKLYAFVNEECGPDNADSLQNQEILLPGHLLSTFVKEKFEEILNNIRAGLQAELRKDYTRTCAKMADTKYWNKTFDRYSGLSSGSIGKKVQVFLSTGNIVSSTGLDLMQVSGFTIVAERLNFLRYCAHFRSVHRGQFFMEMKTTAVRKLLPDQWGFLCPVHTPDGGPCGLLSHLSLKTNVLAYPAKATTTTTSSSSSSNSLDALLIALGVAPSGVGNTTSYTHIPVCLDGRVIGGAPPLTCKQITNHLRKLKAQAAATAAADGDNNNDDNNNNPVPAMLEVALVMPQLGNDFGNSSGGGGGGGGVAPYPGLFLFTCSARLLRPVLQLATNQIEWIGPFEQGFMDIACLQEDIRENVSTHQELDPINMLSLIANLTPLSDHNQSPRNMYQCQMGKQTMGTPCHSLPYRPDNKLYKLQTPQAPIVQTAIHGQYKMDEYPNGTNAVVAVLSYTGFDMEDAMILNKSSFERGFGHASVYKTIQVKLEEEAKFAGVVGGGSESRIRFANKFKRDGTTPMYPNLEDDGLPKVGDCVTEGEALYCVVDSVTNSDRVTKHKEREVAYVQSVRQLGADSGSAAENKASITLRFPRNPVIGDKFSSRHGQKGVLSILWPQEDMPFSESGISPDVIINPHAFPSRMTIGMLVESMAGKSGALHGYYQNGTTFTFHETKEEEGKPKTLSSIDYFGEQLQAAGYNYYGSEPLYSGMSGCIMQADLYIGVVYYQRLRHMVSDKYQVRATGPSNELTRQPIKGRKKGGGIRLGEMERDSLLSHGTAFLLQDRLLNCSDRHVAYACCRCGDLLMPITERNIVQTTGQSQNDATYKPKLRLYCRTPSCIAANRGGNDDGAVEPIVLPYVYRYLVNELAAMNVKMKLEVR